MFHPALQRLLFSASTYVARIPTFCFASFESRANDAVSTLKAYLPTWASVAR